MSVLLDTHFLIWGAVAPDRIPASAKDLLVEPDAPITFSMASIWEVAIKASLGKPDFSVDPSRLRLGLLDRDFQELQIKSEHLYEIQSLPHHHRDPFDRLLIAQARVEGLAFITCDKQLSLYGDPVRLSV